MWRKGIYYEMGKYNYFGVLKNNTKKVKKTLGCYVKPYMTPLAHNQSSHSLKLYSLWRPYAPNKNDKIEVVVS